MFSQRFVLAHEAESLGLVNSVVPEPQLDDELRRLAATISQAPPFLLEMMKKTANGAVDSAGFVPHVRSSLSHWSTWRWHWSTSKEHQQDLTADHGGKSTAKTLAPVRQALEGEAWRQTQMANERARQKSNL